jgi:hypothetical protein
MNYITKSLPAVILLAVAGLLWALSQAFYAAGNAVLSPTSSTNLSQNMGHAADWLVFSGAVVGLLALGAPMWSVVLGRKWEATAELGVGIAAAILIAVGGLVNSVTPADMVTADVILAIGIGVLALLTLVHAARCSLAEQDAAVRPRQATLWLGASAGLTFTAVGNGLSVTPADKGLGIAQGIILAVGAGALACTLIAASVRGFQVAGAVIAGLILLAGYGIGAAIVAGMIYGPGVWANWLNGALGLRVGPPIVQGVYALGLLVLALAAWAQARRLVRAPERPDTPAHHALLVPGQ